MKDIKHLRWYAAQRHADRPQEYEDGVPYWIHLLICELIAIAFGLGEFTRRVCWGHDLKEDTGETHAGAVQAGWSEPEAIAIERCTDEPGATRLEKKLKTLPKTARGGFEAIAPKLCDRGANILWGLLSASFRHHRKYNDEESQFEHYLFDRLDNRLLPLWYFVQSMLARRPTRIAKKDFASRPLRQLIDTWVANKETILNANEDELLRMWHDLKKLLDEQK
jgi:hypothetical protein